jgi:hypothetical protein
MTDLYHPSLPYAQARQRERTARDKLPGIMFVPARERCSCCGKMRTAATGHRGKSGKFTCGMCYEPRRAA